MKTLIYGVLLLLLVSCELTSNITEVTKETKIPYYVSITMRDSTNIKTMQYVESEEKLWIVEDGEIIKQVVKSHDFKSLLLFLWILVVVCVFLVLLMKSTYD